jgi:hypothetical protein
MIRFLTDLRPTPTHTPKTTLKVIGAGLPRTATSYLQTALEQQLLVAAAYEKDKSKRQKLIHRLTDDCEAFCDMPVIFFLSDLMDMYPDAQVIITTRFDAKIWAESCYKRLRFLFMRILRFVRFLWRTDRLWYSLNMRIVKWCRETFGEGGICMAGFFNLYNDVCRERGKEIWKFRAADGWGSLCRSLGVAAPGCEPPMANEKRTYGIMEGVSVVKGLVRWVVLGGLGWVGWLYLLGLMG